MMLSEEETEPEVLLKTCRACMSTKSPFLSLFTDDWLEKFQYCVDIKVSKTSIASALICAKCADYITSYAEFKQKCIKSDVYWRSLKTTHVPVIEIPIERDEIVIKEEIISKFETDTVDEDVPDDNAYHVEETTFLPILKYEEETKKENDPTLLSRLKQRLKSLLKKKDPIKLKSVTAPKYTGTCMKCKQTFASESRLIRHMRMCKRKKLVNCKKPISDLLYCGLCEMTTLYSNKEEMKKHLNEHQSSSKFACKQCDFIAFDFAEFIAHRFEHQPETFACLIYCHLCAKTFRTPRKLEYHFRSDHLKMKPGICRFCKKEFRNYKNWNKHFTLHTRWNFECDHCHLRFLMRSDLVCHMAVHNSKRTCICDICGFGARKLSNLKSHIWNIHEKHTPVTCDKCGVTLKNQRILQRHIYLQHSDAVSCTVCDKKFPSQAALKSHSIWHSDDKPFKCDRCDRSYKAKLHLKVHMRSHTGEKPYECDICFSKFITSGLLKRHKASHSQVKVHRRQYKRNNRLAVKGE